MKLRGLLAVVLVGFSLTACLLAALCLLSSPATTMAAEGYGSNCKPDLAQFTKVRAEMKEPQVVAIMGCPGKLLIEGGRSDNITWKVWAWDGIGDTNAVAFVYFTYDHVTDTDEIGLQ